MIEKVIDLSTNDRSFDLFQKEGEKENTSWENFSCFH